MERKPDQEFDGVGIIKTPTGIGTGPVLARKLLHERRRDAKTRQEETQREARQQKQREQEETAREARQQQQREQEETAREAEKQQHIRKSEEVVRGVQRQTVQSENRVGLLACLFPSNFDTV